MNESKIKRGTERKCTFILQDFQKWYLDYVVTPTWEKIKKIKKNKLKAKFKTQV